MLIALSELLRLLILLELQHGWGQRPPNIVQVAQVTRIARITGRMWPIGP